MSAVDTNDSQEWATLHRGDYVRHKLFLYVRGRQKQAELAEQRICEVTKRLGSKYVDPQVLDNAKCDNSNKDTKAITIEAIKVILIEVVGIIQEVMGLTVAEVLNHHLAKMRNAICEWKCESYYGSNGVDAQLKEKKDKEEAEKQGGYHLAKYLHDLFALVHPNILYGEHSESTPEQALHRQRGGCSYSPDKEMQKRSFRAIIDVLRWKPELGELWDTRCNTRSWRALSNLLSRALTFQDNGIATGTTEYHDWKTIYDELNQYQLEQAARDTEFLSLDKTCRAD
jgi:hypothetical protein